MDKVMDVIFDVDGTLLNIEHRVPLIRPINGGRKDWEAFRAAAIHDKPNMEIVLIAIALYKRGHRIIVCTGRMEQEREVTYEALNMAGVMVDHLFMRPDGDHRPDHVIKLEMLQYMRTEGFKPELVFDDRKQVVDMWRAQGIRVCQVAEGDF